MWNKLTLPREYFSATIVALTDVGLYACETANSKIEQRVLWIKIRWYILWRRRRSPCVTNSRYWFTAFLLSSFSVLWSPRPAIPIGSWQPSLCERTARNFEASLWTTRNFEACSTVPICKMSLEWSDLTHSIRFKSQRAITLGAWQPSLFGWAGNLRTQAMRINWLRV